MVDKSTDWKNVVDLLNDISLWKKVNKLILFPYNPNTMRQKKYFLPGLWSVPAFLGISLCLDVLKTEFFYDLHA